MRELLSRADQEGGLLRIAHLAASLNDRVGSTEGAMQKAVSDGIAALLVLLHAGNSLHDTHAEESPRFKDREQAVEVVRRADVTTLRGLVGHLCIADAIAEADLPGITPVDEKLQALKDQPTP